MKRLLFAAGALSLFCVLPADAQQSSIPKSKFCETYQHKSLDVQKKTVIIPIGPGDDAAGQPDTALTGAFDFAKTLQAILTRAQSQQKPADLLQTMIDSFSKVASDERQPKSNLQMVVDARPGEAGLTTGDLLSPNASSVRMFPIALSNRLDLASVEKGNCGEARILFAKPSESGRRFLLIFEGKVTPLPGPNGEVNKDTCRPVAEFWANLGDKSGQTRADLLSKFYFEGDMGTYGKLASPPISFENLGGSDRGQVRGNLFVAGLWQLREWHIKKRGDRLAFDVAPVADNPLAEFYNSGSVFPESGRGKEQMADFQKAFVEGMLVPLSGKTLGDAPPLVPDTPAVKDLSNDVKTVHSFNFGVTEVTANTSSFDEFQSTAQAFSDVVVTQQPTNTSQAIGIDDAFKDKVTQARPDAGLEVRHVINRAMALTCQGCHQPEGATRPNFSLEISPATGGQSAVFWPKSLNFVHVDENSKLSPALTGSFMPFRAALIKDELCRGPDTPQTDPKVAALIARRASPAASVSLLQQTTTFARALEAARTPSDRNAVQEVIDSEEELRRVTERAQPGSFWPMRRTH
jgi:hypothetical protein